MQFSRCRRAVPAPLSLRALSHAIPARWPRGSLRLRPTNRHSMRDRLFEECGGPCPRDPSKRYRVEKRFIASSDAPGLPNRLSFSLTAIPCRIDLGFLPRSFLPGALPRKEVIQPHLPIRLPCYDFTPVIGLTFGDWLPFRLPHRLRVLPTPMV